MVEAFVVTARPLTLKGPRAQTYDYIFSDQCPSTEKSVFIYFSIPKTKV